MIHVSGKQRGWGFMHKCIFFGNFENRRGFLEFEHISGKIKKFKRQPFFFFIGIMSILDFSEFKSILNLLMKNGNFISIHKFL